MYIVVKCVEREISDLGAYRLLSDAQNVMLSNLSYHTGGVPVECLVKDGFSNGVLTMYENYGVSAISAWLNDPEWGNIDWKILEITGMG